MLRLHSTVMTNNLWIKHFSWTQIECTVRPLLLERQYFENLPLNWLKDSSATANLSVIMVHSKFCSYGRIDVTSEISLLCRISRVISYMNNILIMRSTEGRFSESSRRSCVKRNVDLESTGLPAFKLLHNFTIIYTSVRFIIAWCLPWKTTIHQSFHHFMALDFLKWVLFRFT